jgi:hypothetical protein
VVVYNRLYARQMADVVGEDLQVWVLWEAPVGSAILDVLSSRSEDKKLSLMSPTRGDTTLEQTCVGVFRPRDEIGDSFEGSQPTR